VSLVCNHAEDADEKLTDTQAEQTSDEDGSPAKVPQKEPRGQSANQTSTVKRNGHVERVLGLKAGLLEEVSRIVDELKTAHDLNSPSDCRDLGTPKIRALEQTRPGRVLHVVDLHLVGALH
jgi:hypothetical protein